MDEQPLDVTVVIDSFVQYRTMMVVRRLLLCLPTRWWSLALALACALPSWAASPSITVLTGTTVHCDSTGSDGHPTTTEWFVTSPGSTPPTQPTSTEAAFYLSVEIPGSWTIDLNLEYDHEVDGSPWSSQDRGVIEAKSVVADLDPGGLLFTTTETITLDGSGSQISALAAASATFGVDGVPIGGCSFPGPVTDPATLICTFPASDVGPGTFSVSLELTDSVSGSTDTDKAIIEVIEEPPFTVDFLWNTDGPNPLTLLVELVLSDGWTFGDLQTAVWQFDDGSPAEEVTCTNFNYFCQFWSHEYSTDGFYDVTVTATTTGGHWDSVTHQVTVGDPPPAPTADFTPSPAAATVNSPVGFTFTGSCTDPCTYYWDFGDGSTSTLLNPTHTFIAPIDRQVSLTVTNPMGQDVATQVIPVSNCWSPTGTITQSGSCYGAPIVLTAPAADDVVWNTGANTGTITVAAPTLYWAHLQQGLGCWAYVDHTVSLEQCQGSPEGNVDMDGQGQVDAVDLQALIRELSDGDGQLIIDSWAGELGAPGADLTGTLGPNPDGQITDHDLNRLLEILFAGE